MTAPDRLLRDAGGARPRDELDALIERLQGFNPPDRTIASQRDYSQAIYDAADALVQLRDSEALVRGKIAEQLIKIEWLERMKQNYYDEAVKGWSKCRAAEAELDTQNRALAQCRALLKQEIDDVVPLRERIAALEAERADLIKINNGWAHEWDAMREERDALLKAAPDTPATR